MTAHLYADQEPGCILHERAKCRQLMAEPHTLITVTMPRFEDAFDNTPHSIISDVASNPDAF